MKSEEIYRKVKVEERLPSIANENYLTISEKGFETSRFFNGKRFETAHYEGEIVYWLEKCNLSEPTTPPQASVSAEEILTQVANEHSYETWGEMMYDTHEHSQVEYTKEAMLLFANQPVTFNPPRPPKEEAERLLDEHYDVSIDIVGTEAIQCAIIDQQNTITALQLRGLSTQHEEEVLTILKGM